MLLFYLIISWFFGSYYCFAWWFLGLIFKIGLLLFIFSFWYLTLPSFHGETSSRVMLERGKHLLGLDIRLVLGWVHETTTVDWHWGNALPDYLRILWKELVMFTGIRGVTGVDTAIFLGCWSDSAHLIISSTFPYSWDLWGENFRVCHWVLLTV